MDSLYTNEVRQYVHTRDWPKGLVLQTEEYTEPAPFLQFVFYRDNFNTFPREVQQQIANTINEVMMKLRKDGIPCYLEVQAAVPNA